MCWVGWRSACASEPPAAWGAAVLTAPKFWETKALDAMTDAEWEALCDGCGRCCLLKLEDEDDGQIAYTRIACRLFDADACRCGAYERRHLLVPGCVRLTAESIREAARWMPRTCAYRLLTEGKPLPDWHPLVTGDPASVEAAGVSVRGWTIPEYEVHEQDYEDHVIPGLH
jgi:uncharacterized cysteine cluster protein YcgN (CxxCxxCC family)